MEIVVIGIAVSLFVQLVKKYSTGEWMTMGITLVATLSAAGIYTYLLHAGYWDSLLPILTVAGAFYTFVIQRFEK